MLAVSKLVNAHSNWPPGLTGRDELLVGQTIESHLAELFVTATTNITKGKIQQYFEVFCNISNKTLNAAT